MADSEDKKKDTALVPVVKEEIAKNPKGDDYSTRLRGSDGKFKRKEKNMPSGREMTRYLRNFLTQPKPDEVGKIVKGGKTRLQIWVETLDEGMNLRPKETDNIADVAKLLSAQSQVFERVMKRAFGDKAISDEEMEAAKQQSGIRFVLIQPPDTTNSRPKQELATPTKPSFIDAEFTEDPKKDPEKK